MPVIRRGRPSDFEAAADLLRASGLPLEGFAEHFANSLVADEAAGIVGCVALELYGETALLRSLAVASDRRGEGIGERLTAAALADAKLSGARDVYLLTQSAEKFFPRFGFGVEERALAPEILGRSEEFRSACPASAVMMRAKVSA
ncbi:MAG: arsenic resistance N-acetyltransferase ArsN2 [Acidobacteriota bacterium]|nr:arsenic resistance N-acetyltransferase ArsN2 [Acidobacteriota bacterium]